MQFAESDVTTKTLLRAVQL